MCPANNAVSWSSFSGLSISVLNTPPICFTFVNTDADAISVQGEKHFGERSFSFGLFGQ